MDLEKIWSEVQGRLSKDMKGPSFQTWIKPSKLIEVNNHKAVIAVKNEFNKNFLKQCYIQKICLAVEKTLRQKIELEIVVKHDLDIKEFIPSIATLGEKNPNLENKQSETSGFFDHTFKYKTHLNPTYTFESFVVGQNNQFCHAAALAISESHSQQYNPLFIYGGVGLGKTHLAHAIANYTLTQDETKNVQYITSETFTNELIGSIRSNNMGTFREKYRKIDLLMIDDVQFLAGKEATQEEFFHTFNTLKESGKQIILTADRPPNLLSSMTDRLRSRFEGGLIADIQVPDLETRTAILMLKASQMNICLQADVAEYIATIFSNNIRELEGALKRVHAYLSFTHEEINLRNVQKVLSSSIGPQQSNLSPEIIIKTIASYYNLPYEGIISTKRSADLSSARHVAIYMLHDIYNLSFPRIGELFSNRTHSSAIYAYQQTKKKLTKDPQFSQTINSLRGILEKKKVYN